MSDTLFKIKQIASLVFFVGVLSLMGMMTSRPVMILAYAGFFITVTALMLYLNRKRSRHFEVAQSSSKLMSKIVGWALLALSLVTPALIAFRTNVISIPKELGIGATFGIVAGATIAFLALFFASLYMLNVKGKELSQRIIGYALFILAAALPGILMSRVNGTTSGIGSVYYVAMVVLILAFNGIRYLYNRD